MTWLLCAALVAVSCASTERVSAGAHPTTPEVSMFNKNTDYEQLMGRWSRRLAPLHVRFAKVKDGDRVLDVGAGTGVLALSLESSMPSSQIGGIDPSPEFIDYAQHHAASPRVRFEVGDAQALRFPSASFDVTLAQLVMNFIPDPEKAAREMRRVTRAGGAVSACVWGYDDGMEMLRYFWDEVVALNPAMASRDERTMKFARQGELAALWRGAGLVHVEEAPLEIELPFSSFDDYWRPFLAGVGPAGAYVASVSEAERAKIASRLRARLLPGRDDGPFTLKARAWCARGEVPQG